VKVYFGLDSDQRLDVQLISNTVIAVSADLYDRMQETVRGPETAGLVPESGTACARPRLRRQEAARRFWNSIVAVAPTRGAFEEAITRARRLMAAGEFFWRSHA